MLGEWPGETKPSDYITLSDVAIRFENNNGEKFIFIIEIKFTENEFNPCNGYTSKGRRRFIDKFDCENFHSIVDDNNKCYLHKSYGSRSAREYFNYIKLKEDLKEDIISEQKECPFIDNHQCLRNHALARATKQKEIFKRAFFVLVYHDGNEKYILNEWKNYRSLFKNCDDLFSIKASEIVRKYNNDTYQLYFEERYGLK